MAVKHVQDYYNQLARDYHELIQTLEDMQEAGMPPEKVQQIKDMISISKTNFERWSYMIYLLNKPNNKKKQKGYERQYSKKISNNTDLFESKQTLERLSQFEEG